MASDALVEVLKKLRDEVPAELHGVLDALVDGSDDGPEEAWHQVLKETLGEG